MHLYFLCVKVTAGTITVTQITTHYNQDLQNTISEHTTHRTLKQMCSSSRRPHRVPLLSDKNSTRRIQFTQTQQNWTTEDRKHVVWSDESGFLLHSDVGSEFGVKNMKAWIILPCLNGSGWWWCNGVGGIFLTHFGSLSINRASFKHHSLPEYCFWPCPSLYDYSVHIFWCTSSRIMHHVTKIKSSQTGFLNMTMSSLYSNDLHSHQISIQ